MALSKWVTSEFNQGTMFADLGPMQVNHRDDADPQGQPVQGAWGARGEEKWFLDPERGWVAARPLD